MRAQFSRRCYSDIARSNKRNASLNLPNTQALPVPPILQFSPSDTPPRPRQSLEALTPFQKALAANPHAQALATPVRACAYTGARLPSHFLVPFTTVFRPDQHGKPLPHLVPVVGTSHKQVARTYVCNSLPLIRRLGSKKAWHRLLPHDLDFGLKRREEYQRWENPEHIILAQLRQDVLRKLRWPLTKPETKLALIHSPHDTCPESASIIFLDKQAEQSLLHQPAVPSYQLLDMLQEDMLKQLLVDTQFADAQAIALRHSYMTMSAHAALARLSMFCVSHQVK